MNKFSTPLPFNKQRIDEFAQINEQVEKSKIVTLYNSLPTESKDFCGFEQPRCNNEEPVKTLDDFLHIVEYALNKGFDFVYLINSPRIFKSENKKELEEQFDKLDKIITGLKKLGLNKFRISNPQLMQYLNLNYPEVKIYVSTSLELNNVKQVENILYSFNNVEEIIPNYEQNKNFLFLKNLRKKFPNLKIELMANEGCIAGCPFRKYHSALFPWKVLKDSGNFESKYETFYKTKCNSIRDRSYWEYFCTLAILYPWEIKEYNKIGIDHFKFVGRDSLLFGKKGYSNILKWYLMSVDNEHYADDIPHNLFSSYVWKGNSKIKIKDIKKYLPKIEHFKKYGHICSSRCGIECRYCYDCAAKLSKKYKESEIF